MREARQAGVQVALSNPCFEFWLLLHHEHAEGLSTCSDVEARLRERLGEYRKTNLKAEHYPLGSVPEACARAEALDGRVSGGDIPDGNTSRVYRLWKALAAKALPSQLPRELRGLGRG